MQRLDLTNQRFTRLLVLSRAPCEPGFVAWHCLCDCGKQVIVRTAHLRRADRPTRSCGCFASDALQAATRDNPRIKHGRKREGSADPTYRSWVSARDRCSRPTFKFYANYGGRGIRMCERWDDFSNFLADMGERPPGRTLDRIDVNGNYEPGNCRWATWSEQNKNKRNSK